MRSNKTDDVTPGIEAKPVFAVGMTDEGIPLVIIGIPKGGWNYIKDGETHHFDFTKVGLPFKLLIFGEKNHASVMTVLEQAIKERSMVYENQMNRDFGIEPKQEKPK